MQDGRFFLETLSELRQRTLSTASEYDVLKASGLLRLLLVERFAQDVSQNAGIPLVFRGAQQLEIERPAEGVLMDVNWLELDPRHISPEHQRVELTLDEFLQRPLMRLFDEDFTVKNVIRVAANGLGGVHRGRITISFDKRLAKRTEGSSVSDALNDNLHIVVSQVRQIAMATREACEPLRVVLSNRSL